MQTVVITGGGQAPFAVTLSNGEVIELQREEPKSTDLVLAGLASCSARTLDLVMRRMRMKPPSIELSISAQRAPDPPQVFTRIDMLWRIQVPAADEDRLRRGLELAESHCTVFNILKLATPIHVAVEIDAVPPDGHAGGGL
ncbi:MAG TPA: OsmC family protein [Candidatus Nitrosotalea sp.]|nr:OsmC family protein [Candidatus Nitrosotalea sp.]